MKINATLLTSLTFLVKFEVACISKPNSLARQSSKSVRNYTHSLDLLCPEIKQEVKPTKSVNFERNSILKFSSHSLRNFFSDATSSLESP